MRSLTVFIALALLAQDPAGFVMWKPSEITDRAKSAKADATGMAGGGIGSLEGYKYQAIVVRRDKTGEAESHEKLADMMIVTDGEATLKIGGQVVEKRPNTADEIRGKALADGSTQVVEKKIGPGVIIYLPPGLPHWVVLPEGKQITYLLLKLDKK
jgi:mannose-6-phosphate isomerase-like protein (cupin superfamily)